MNTWEDGRPLAENILRNILYRDGLLHEEAELLLRQELSNPRQYFAVLQAIARGRTRNNAIVQHTGLDKAQVYQHLRTLERLQLIEQRRPITASPSSLKTSYAILDGYLNFYFAFVEPPMSPVCEDAPGRRHLDQTVMPRARRVRLQGQRGRPSAASTYNARTRCQDRRGAGGATSR